MAQASPGLTGPRVLVVMDDPLAKVLEVVLRHGRYQSHVTADRAEFSRLLSSWAPHVVLLDLDLHPTFLELSQSGPNKAVPTLVFTRRRDTALKLRAFEHGAEDILRIPFLLSEIVARLYAVVRRTQGIEVPLLPRIRVEVAPRYPGSAGPRHRVGPRSRSVGRGSAGCPPRRAQRRVAS